MPNLDNIHYKFFPKAKTAPYGKTLIKFAWVIEILVAMVGLTIAGFLYMKAVNSGVVTECTEKVSEFAKTASDFSEEAYLSLYNECLESAKSREYIKTWTDRLAENIDGVIVSLAFVVVSVVELTKIPLATAFYYAAKYRWKITFIVALILINISTFETIIQGFELGFYKRSNEVAKIKQKLEDINSQINQKSIGAKNDRRKLSEQEEKIFDTITSLNKNITQINIEKNNQIDALKDQAALANPQIATLQKQIDDERQTLKDYKISENNKISEKNKTISDLEKITDFKGSLTLSRKKQAEQRDLKVLVLRKDLITFENSVKNEIETKQTFIRTLENKKTTLEGVVTRDIKDKIVNIESISILDKEKIEIDLNNKREELTLIQSKTNDFDQKTLNYENEILDLNEQCVLVADKLERVAADNQTYRFAIKIKSFAKWFTNLNLSSILPWNWGEEKAIIENKNVEEKIKEKKCSSSSAALLSDDDLNFAFWLWFGTLAFVISVIGTLIALAGLHLQDERMHEIRNRPMKERFARFFRNIAWIPVYINKIIWAGIKRLIRPKIVEKEVVVEKIVEKIVEKNIGEKIVYEKVEVPKEVVRKELVYVPLPTDDEELLKRGPFTPVDKDKKK